MANYAYLDENNIVTQVIVGIEETELIEGVDPETWYGNFRGQTCKRTSYNHKIRKQYAGIGYSYDPKADVFIAPKPYTSWILNKSHDWEAPVSYPDDGQVYLWNEDAKDWVVLEDPTQES